MPLWERACSFKEANMMDKKGSPWTSARSQETASDAGTPAVPRPGDGDTCLDSVAIRSPFGARFPDRSNADSAWRKIKLFGVVFLAGLGLVTLHVGQPDLAEAQSGGKKSSTTRPQVWFHPNIGSEDLLRLFKEPNTWARARARIDVFGFNFPAVRDPNNNISIRRFGGPNTWTALQRVDAVRQLIGWGKAINITAQSIQLHPVPPPAVENAEAQAKLTIEALDNVYAAGGRVQYITMDSPYFFSQPGRCNYTFADTIRAIQAYVESVHAKYPDVQIGENTQYPNFTAGQIKQWIDALTAAGVPPAFEHLDINYQLLLRPRQTAARIRFTSDLPALVAYIRQQGISCGLVCTTTGIVNSNQQYYTGTCQSIQLWQSALRANPDHLVFQSWAEDPTGRKIYPSNLPETGSYSLTALVNNYPGL
jgi:hypothetical protein